MNMPVDSFLKTIPLAQQQGILNLVQENSKIFSRYYTLTSDDKDCISYIIKRITELDSNSNEKIPAIFATFLHRAVQHHPGLGYTIMNFAIKNIQNSNIKNIINFIEFEAGYFARRKLSNTDFLNGIFHSIRANINCENLDDITNILTHIENRDLTCKIIKIIIPVICDEMNYKEDEFNERINTLVSRKNIVFTNRERDIFNEIYYQITGDIIAPLYPVAKCRSTRSFSDSLVLNRRKNFQFSTPCSAPPTLLCNSPKNIYLNPLDIFPMRNFSFTEEAVNPTQQTNIAQHNTPSSILHDMAKASKRATGERGDVSEAMKECFEMHKKRILDSVPTYTTNAQTETPSFQFSSTEIEM